MKASMEPMLYAAGVDILFAGHVHAYERSVICRPLHFVSSSLFKLQFIYHMILLQERVYNDNLDPCGAVHVTIGDGGNREGLAHR